VVSAISLGRAEGGRVGASCAVKQTRGSDMAQETVAKPPPTLARVAVSLKRSAKFVSAARSESSPVRILTATWNVGNAKPDEGELAQWLPANGGAFDMIVIGTQENAFKTRATASAKSPEADDDDDEAEAAMAAAHAATEADRASTPRRERSRSRRSSVSVASVAQATKLHGGWVDDAAESRSRWRRPTAPHAWDRMCAKRLGDGWMVCAHVTLREMRLTVYCTRALAASRIGHVATAYSATGLGTVFGNKGGLVARLSIGPHTTIAFCSCHLAAHEGASHLKNRNAMCREVLLETMGGKIGGVRGRGRPLDAAHSVDHLIWLGDLHYRVDLETLGHEHELPLRQSSPPAELTAHLRNYPPTPAGSSTASPTTDGLSAAQAKQRHASHVSAAISLAAAGEYETLLRADQLCASRASGDAFVGFKEGRIDFAPTFKVERREGLTHLSQRTPSYCDRILWKSMPPCAGLLEQTELTSVERVSTSDHKPVVAAFTLTPSAGVFRSATAVPASPASPASLAVGRCTIKVSNLSVRDILVSDFIGTSDPFCVFFTHPEGLITTEGRRRTTIKPRVRAGATSGATGDAVFARGLTKQLSRMASSPRLGATRDMAVARWKDAEVPVLKVNCSMDELDKVCLLVAVFDYDRWKKNDPLGVVTIPLARPASLTSGPSEGSEEEEGGGAHRPRGAADAPRCGYDLHIKEHIVLGHSTTGTGSLCCSLRVNEMRERRGSFLSRLGRSFSSGASLRRASTTGWGGTGGGGGGSSRLGSLLGRRQPGSSFKAPRGTTTTATATATSAPTSLADVRFHLHRGSAPAALGKGTSSGASGGMNDERVDES
jgi:hypothetical protein